MAQTTDSMASAGFKVEVSTDGTSWTDVSGTASAVTVDGGDVKVGSQHTAEGDEAVVVTSNKVEPRTVTVKSLYTETETEAFSVIHAAYASASKKIFLRWSPAGGGVGDLRYTCAVGGSAAAVPIVSCTLPELDTGTEDPAMFEFSVMTPGLLKAVIAS